MLRRRVQQLDGAADHPAIHVAVDLGEVAGLEAQVHAELGQLVAEHGVPGPQRRDGGLVAGLLVDVQPGALAEGDQRGAVGLAQRLQIAEHQAADLVAHGHLDLRQARAYRQPADQLRELAEAVRHPGVEDVALADVRDERAHLLAKTHEYAVALGGDELHPEPGLAPVAPGFAGQRLQPLLRAHAAHVLEQLGEHLPLVTDLVLGREVLETAAAAGAVVRAARLDPPRRALQDLQQPRLVASAVALDVLEAHPLAGQRAVDEHGLVRDVGDAAALVTHTLDGGFHRLAGNPSLASCHASPVLVGAGYAPCQAARNSFRWG
ncbi:hypothetical protein KBTX_02975 [wastewater metagenome]|uniref:Uncharacterized protein n=2 Tax=unclassified sequences TaxID=12908 RepID=A0A5B8RI37_9ZZZZ|nr:hypothetical protein KBTEX_02975 [uncultured organism]